MDGVVHSTPNLWIAGSHGRHRQLYTIALTLSPCVGVPDRGVADDCVVPRIHRNAGGGPYVGFAYYWRTIYDFRRKRSGHRPDCGSCNGDMRGALKALLLVNEQL